jgi:ABC-type transport system substrate-binding protein
MQKSRRRFIILAASLASTAILQTESRAASPELSENDPTAQTLGYKSDAAHVDPAKYPKYQTGQMCANCQLYQGKPGDALGPCAVFPGKQVSSKGWCSAYTKKA